MKQIWAPWRMAYIDDQARKEGCIFCDKPKADDARTSLVLAQTAHSVVMLNKYPYNSGHLLVAPKKHEKQLSSLLPQERRRKTPAVKNRRHAGRKERGLIQEGRNGSAGMSTIEARME